MTSSHLINLYNKLPVTFVKGEGVWLYDDKGDAYLDALSGIGVNALGHCHPAITETIIHQAQQVLHTCNIYHSPPLTALANKLCAMSGMDKVYFANSGTEVTEAAIKIARLYGTRHKNIKTPKIIVMKNCFHGRTLGAWSAADNANDGTLGRLLHEDYLKVPFNDSEAIERLADQHNDIVGVMLEPIQGKYGCIPFKPDYLKAVREICDKHDWLMICDEVQSGMGRTGKLFAYQHEGILPDIVVTAKSLGNGIPIGAYLTNPKVADVFQPGDHGSTLGGNTFACAVALTVLNTLEKERLFTHVEMIGKYLVEQLEKALSPFECFERIQGKGLMIGIKLKHELQGALQIGLTHKILFNHAGKDVIRLLPPFIITTADADEIVKRLTLCFEEF